MVEAAAAARARNRNRVWYSTTAVVLDKHNKWVSEIATGQKCPCHPLPDLGGAVKARRGRGEDEGDRELCCEGEGVQVSREREAESWQSA